MPELFKIIKSLLNIFVISDISVKKISAFVNTMPPETTKFEKAIFSAKVIVKVTGTLVLFERAYLVEYACQIRSLYL